MQPELAEIARSVHDSITGVAGYWRQLATMAEERYGRGSLEHDLARERVHHELCQVRRVRDLVRRVDGDTADEVTAALCARERLPPPGEWDAFWPPHERDAHLSRVQAARGGRRRGEARRRWDLLLADGRRDLGIDFSSLAAPDWLLTRRERIRRALR